MTGAIGKQVAEVMEAAHRNGLRPDDDLALLLGKITDLANAVGDATAEGQSEATLKQLGAAAQKLADAATVHPRRPEVSGPHDRQHVLEVCRVRSQEAKRERLCAALLAELNEGEIAPILGQDAITAAEIERDRLLRLRHAGQDRGDPFLHVAGVIARRLHGLPRIRTRKKSGVPCSEPV